MIGTAPYYINWNYTYACNLKCNHCYSRSPKYLKDLSPERYMDIAKQIIKANVFTVGFGGGEPTTRKDLVDVISTLSDGGVDTHLTTNGWFLKEKYVERLKETELGMLLVSLDSHDKATNDSIRNSEGSFNKACDAIRLSKSVGLNTYVASVANAENINDLGRLVELACSLDADGLNLKIFRPVGGAVKSKDRFELSDSKKEFLAKEIERLKREYTINITTYQDSDGGKCSCGVSNLH